jgi:hypothetical protein
MNVLKTVVISLLVVMIFVLMMDVSVQPEYTKVICDDHDDCTDDLRIFMWL